METMTFTLNSYQDTAQIRHKKFSWNFGIYILISTKIIYLNRQGNKQLHGSSLTLLKAHDMPKFLKQFNILQFEGIYQ